VISYALLGTNDVERAKEFYDALLAELGAEQLFSNENVTAWGTDPASPKLGVIKPFDGNPATVGNGTMVALTADSEETVDRVHKKALELGGKDEGAPGPRGEMQNYIGYFRDLDGNKLDVIYMKPMS
jgi:catechol 2,3-dioxygenase-like lactoylglutathione lyase family enzyme